MRVSTEPETRVRAPEPGAVSLATGIATVVGRVLHELPEFVVVAAVSTGFGPSRREVGPYEAAAIWIVIDSVAVVYLLLGHIPSAPIAIGRGTVGSAFALLEAWDGYEIATGRRCRAASPSGSACSSSPDSLHGRSIASEIDRIAPSTVTGGRTPVRQPRRSNTSEYER